MLVFSTTDRESFEAISSWREKVVAEVGDIPTALVQSKIDLLDDSCIKNEEAEALAKKLKLRFYRTSVKEDLNVSEVFKYLAEKYLQKLKQQIAENPESMHSSSNKIGKYPECFSPMFTWQIYFPFIIIFTLKDTKDTVCSFL